MANLKLPERLTDIITYSIGTILIVAFLNPLRTAMASLSAQVGLPLQLDFIMPLVIIVGWILIGITMFIPKDN